MVILGPDAVVEPLAVVVELRAASVARPAVLGPLLDVCETDATVEIEGLAIVCRGIVEFKVM